MLIKIMSALGESSFHVGAAIWYLLPPLLIKEACP